MRSSEQGIALRPYGHVPVVLLPVTGHVPPLQHRSPMLQVLPLLTQQIGEGVPAAAQAMSGRRNV